MRYIGTPLFTVFKIKVKLAGIICFMVSLIRVTNNITFKGILINAGRLNAGASYILQQIN